MMKFIAALILSFCAPVGAQDIRTQAHELADEVGRLDLGAGLTQAQADTVAWHYAQRYIGNCGSTDPAIDRGLDWEVTPITGVAGVAERDAIVIEKHTGRISWKNGPTVDLADLIESKEAPPMPINTDSAKPRHLPDDALTATTKIQFVVSPSGAVSAPRIERSSRNLKCDLAAMRDVEGWRFSPRKQPITLVARVKSCSR